MTMPTMFASLLQRHSRKFVVIKRLGLVAALYIIAFIASLIVSYHMRPQIRYSLKQADCSATAIAARNKTAGYVARSCVLIISATNLQKRTLYVDYDGVGGGPLGGSDPLIRINAAHNKFCYALPAGEGSSFTPNATNDITLHCSRIQNPPTNYDETSDTSPTSIEIGGPAKVILNVSLAG
jgi:hypothetical protein